MLSFDSNMCIVHKQLLISSLCVYCLAQDAITIMKDIFKKIKAVSRKQRLVEIVSFNCIMGQFNSNHPMGRQ